MITEPLGQEEANAKEVVAVLAVKEK